MWCLIGFHGNQSFINDVTSGRRLGFLYFEILFKFELNTDIVRKQYLHVAIVIYKIVRILGKLLIFSHFFRQKVELT